jgi:hypothetical protein
MQPGEKRKNIRWLMILLLLLVSAGCVSKKLNGFQEIAERNPIGMEEATATDEGAELIRQLGRYIAELEEMIENGH